jgi:hypothetical protein
MICIFACRRRTLTANQGAVKSIRGKTSSIFGPPLAAAARFQELYPDSTRTFSAKGKGADFKAPL